VGGFTGCGGRKEALTLLTPCFKILNATPPLNTQFIDFIE
jgi:hypothetical protein